jgi:hypothetical protein
MNSTIDIIDTTTGSLIKSYSLEESEKAYQEAANLEELGLSVTVKHPGAAVSLVQSLGASNLAIEELKEEMNEEMESHDEPDSCCFKTSDSK